MTDPAFDAAIAVVLEHEGFGAIVDHPVDPGGITKWGISLRLLRSLGDGGGDLDGDGDVDAADVAGMSRDQAVAIYRRAFWQPGRYSLIFSEAVAVKLFDLVVNMGPAPAHRCAQRALRACGRPVVEDGMIGPITRCQVNATPAEILLPALRAEAAGFYRLLVAADRFRATFLEGWLRRAYW